MKTKERYLKQFLRMAAHFSTIEGLEALLDSSDSEHLMIARLMLSRCALTAEEEEAVAEADARFRAAFTEALLNEYEQQIPGEHVRAWWGPVPS